ncbi:MAG: hypothetical protein JO279_18010, partial [Verrucomicrobia bacterium]|nr:hypothetical protein [Verrucomicrobiota bacterium]
MRKPIVLLLLGFLASAAYGQNTPDIQPADTGLPKNVVPRNYLIYLEPNPETRVTEGVEAIGIEVLTSTNRIVLNSLETQITMAKIEGGGRQEQLIPRLNANEQAVWFELKSVLPAGNYTLTIKFQSKINEQPLGLFIQDGEDERAGARDHVLATAQQTSSSSRIFPCWDEPSFPATFQLSLLTGKQNTTISNTPLQLEQALGPNQKIVVFEKTPSMATDMVSLVCGVFESLDDEVAGVKLRILTVPGKRALGSFAMGIAKQLLPYFEEYCAIPFPLLNFDQVAIPSGADDGGGISSGIICDESALLCDAQTSCESTRQKVFLSIAKKLASKWCGDAPVTLRSDLWLSEGLASWMARKATDHFYPQWKIWLHAAVDKEAAMACDAGDMAQAIQPRSPAEGKAGKASNVLLEQKLWLLLRMLENFSGEGSFREGLRGYLAAPKTAETTTGDELWASLERATGKSIKKMMVAWTEQPGFPLIKVTTQCLNGNRVISLEQVPFAIAERGERSLAWSVPVGIRTTAKSSEVKYALLDKLTNNFDLPGCSGVLQANAGNAGYFRVLYEPALFNDLRKKIETLPESDRINLST